MKWFGIEHYLYIMMIGWFNREIAHDHGQSVGLLIGTALAIGLVFLDAYLEYHREYYPRDPLTNRITKIWVYFAVCFYALMMLLLIGLTIWALVEMCQKLFAQSFLAALFLFFAADIVAVFALTMFKHLQRNLHYLRY
ncbi:hypothetical protein [Wielerella bovis]|uniref:hypothetical protein n=1 Tax=Wielerella bovis TaxID=2917790 RepID=UPI0020194FD7|nr:hypothetical protein [Wielerella bovis]ULJ62024.1 hypothetical protein MIS46_08530 [Wielerella bovis]ULJ64251.1 hypothetical protein MIS33_08845 [Wielerella bovis]ULJ67830.1 hypothetical protein MIS31_04610 [Wielerella bovis]ULJ68786.1 hypothetical protein MIS45_08360 [Wielerella bovis]